MGGPPVSWASSLLPGLSGAYALARRSGLLGVPWFRRGYSWAYFSYKRLLEDPFDGLVRLRPDLFRGGLILDVGAHIGYTTSLFVGAMSPGSRLYAFEPEAENYALLCETIERRGARDRVVAVHAAVGDTEGSIGLWRNPQHPGDHRVATEAFRRQAENAFETTPVRLVSLDGFLASVGEADTPVAFVKIDVQGYEPAVCRGMTKLLERSPDVTVAIEFAPRELRSQNFAATDLLSFFRERGHAIHVLAKDGTVRLVCDGTPDVESTGRGYGDLLCSRRKLDG
jgi:FkbM family methyltransferase